MWRHLTLLFVLLSATAGWAQPYVWVAKAAVPGPTASNAVAVLNLATASLHEIPLPGNFQLGGGAIDPLTGRYLVISSHGTGQFQMSPPAFLADILPWTGDRLYLSPDGRYAYVCANATCALMRRSDNVTVAMLTGVQSVDFGSNGGHIVITKAGTGLITVRYSLAETPQTTVWTREFADGSVFATDGARLYAASDRLAAIDLRDSRTLHYVENTRCTTIAAGGGVVACRLLTGSVDMLRAYDSETFTLLAEKRLNAGLLAPFFAGMKFTIDGSRLVEYSYAARGGMVSAFTVLDPRTLDAPATNGGGGSAGVGFVIDADITSDTWCNLTVTTATEFQLPASGGVVQVEVSATPNCDSWPVRFGEGDGYQLYGPSVRNGSSSLRVEISQNVATYRVLRSFFVGRNQISVFVSPQTELPMPPRVTDVFIEGTRATAHWEPADPGPFPWRGFVVEGGPVAGAAVASITLGQAARSVALNDLPSGEYFVRVRSVNEVGTGPASASRRFAVAPTVAPRTPVGLTAEVRGASVRLTWAPPETGTAPEFYVIEASVNGNPFVPVARTTSSTPEFLGGNLPPGAYRVRIRSANRVGVSDASAAIAIAPTACAGPPGAPEAVEMLATGRRTTVRWLAPREGADQYVIDAEGAGGLAGQRVQFATGSPATTIDLAAPTGNYIVRVRAQNACGTGPASADKAVTVLYASPFIP